MEDAPSNGQSLLETTYPQRPKPDAEALKNFYVGKKISEVPKPAAILDVAKIRRHCSSMLDTMMGLGVDFRPHVKTHKTTEVTRLQIGEKSPCVNIVFSTLAELEHLIPLLQECLATNCSWTDEDGETQTTSRTVNALYGIPLPPSKVSRLASLGRQLGSGSISVMVDHATQLNAVEQLSEQMGVPPKVFLKVDTGYHRAGLPSSGLNKDGLVERLTRLHADRTLKFLGLYSHSSLSYNDSTPEAALKSLAKEIQECEIALHEITHLFDKKEEFQAFDFDEKMVISVGATPQIVAAHHLKYSETAVDSQDADTLRNQLLGHRMGKGKYNLEFHAGVYSILDMQQVSTNAWAKAETYEDEISITVAAEVISTYNEGERAQPEALLAVGALGLGREPCAHYKGWGVVKGATSSKEQGLNRRLIVTRISQEHSIVSWEYDSEKEPGRSLPPIPLEVGQVVEIFPNHACITGAMYDWYLVIDSDKEEKSRISDVWVRTSGW